MSLSTQTPNVGAKRYLALVSESSWGSFPGSPTYVHVPVLDYGVKFNASHRQDKSFAGLLQRKHARNFKGMPGGPARFHLYGWQPGALGISLAEFLLTWAFSNYEALDLPSKSAEWYRGPNVGNQRDLGLRVNQATLTGSEDQPIVLAVDLQGKDQVGNSVVSSAQALPDDRNRLVEFLFEDSTLELNGQEIAIGGFTRTLNRALKSKSYNSTRPLTLRATDYLETFSITKPKDDDAWQDVVRSLDPEDAHTATLTLKGLHLGTGTALTDFAQVAIEWPLLSVVSSDVQGGRDDLEDDAINFVCLKPDTSDNTHTTTWDDV